MCERLSQVREAHLRGDADHPWAKRLRRITRLQRRCHALVLLTGTPYTHSVYRSLVPLINAVGHHTGQSLPWDPDEFDRRFRQLTLRGAMQKIYFKYVVLLNGLRVGLIAVGLINYAISMQFTSVLMDTVPLSAGSLLRPEDEGRYVEVLGPDRAVLLRRPEGAADGRLFGRADRSAHLRFTLSPGDVLRCGADGWVTASVGDQRSRALRFRLKDWQPVDAPALSPGTWRIRSPTPRRGGWRSGDPAREVREQVNLPVWGPAGFRGGRVPDRAPARRQSACPSARGGRERVGGLTLNLRIRGGSTLEVLNPAGFAAYGREVRFAWRDAYPRPGLYRVAAVRGPRGASACRRSRSRTARP